MKQKLKETIADILAYLLQVERRKLLWSSTATSFNAQTLTISGLSNYDFLDIEAMYVGNDGNNNFRMTTRIPVGYRSTIFTKQGSGNAMASRGVTFGTDKITFTNGYLAYGTTQSTTNIVAVPTKIYGIKSGGGTA